MSKIDSTTRITLIRIAHHLPKGSDLRNAIIMGLTGTLSGMTKYSGSPKKDLWIQHIYDVSSPGHPTTIHNLWVWWNANRHPEWRGVSPTMMLNAVQGFTPDHQWIKLPGYLEIGASIRERFELEYPSILSKLKDAEDKGIIYSVGSGETSGWLPVYKINR